MDLNYSATPNGEPSWVCKISSSLLGCPFQLDSANLSYDHCHVRLHWRNFRPQALFPPEFANDFLTAYRKEENVVRLGSSYGIGHRSIVPHMSNQRRAEVFTSFVEPYVEVLKQVIIFLSIIPFFMCKLNCFVCVIVNVQLHIHEFPKGYVFPHTFFSEIHQILNGVLFGGNVDSYGGRASDFEAPQRELVASLAADAIRREASLQTDLRMSKGKIQASPQAQPFLSEHGEMMIDLNRNNLVKDSDGSVLFQIPTRNIGGVDPRNQRSLNLAHVEKLKVNFVFFLPFARGVRFS